MTNYHEIERLEARLRRLETRLCKLMIHMGMDPQTNEPLGEVPATPPKDYHSEHLIGGVRNDTPRLLFSAFRKPN